MNKKDDLGFVVAKFFFVTMVHKFKHTHCFLEAFVKGLRRNGLRFFLSTKHIMEENIASINGASSRSNFIKEVIADPVEGIGLVSSAV